MSLRNNINCTFQFLERVSRYKQFFLETMSPCINNLITFFGQVNVHQFLGNLNCYCEEHGNNRVIKGINVERGKILFEIWHYSTSPELYITNERTRV